ncbi:MAG: homoserine kinase [Anaerolineae bacterium]
MQKLKIRLPATVTNLGPGLNALGLALGLYTTVEISGRQDTTLNVQVSGEGAEQFSIPLRHPVVRAMARFFQHLERAHLGINIRIENNIPLKSGLGAETAFTVAGILGANNLMGGLFNRDTMLRMAAEISGADGVVAALLGGLVIAILDDDTLIYRALPVRSFPVVVVVPELKNYAAPVLPEQISRREALFNLSRVPFLIEALRAGDLRLFTQMLPDQLYAPRVAQQITGYPGVAEAALNNGALAVTPCGEGPALMAFAESRHERVGTAMLAAFKDIGVNARSWVLPIDTQGVVISAVQSAM